MNTLTIIISAVTAFIIAAGGAIGVAIVGGPLTKWQVAPYTLSVEPTTPTLTGFSLRNDAWVTPYNDAPLDGTYAVNVDFFAAYMEDLDNLPDASCGYQTVVVTP